MTHRVKLSGFKDEPPARFTVRRSPGRSPHPVCRCGLHQTSAGLATLPPVLPP